MRVALVGLERFIVPFGCCEASTSSSGKLPLSFQVTQSVSSRVPTTPPSASCTQRFHELWSLRLGTSLEDRPRYTPTTTFETFPFPAGMTPRDTAPKAGQACAALHGRCDILAENIAAAARRLNELRENWLNPPEWVDWVITPEEEKAGFPKRPVAKPGHEADLKKRTLTNLYNQRPAWLDLAHKALDQAVAAAYGWTDYTPETPDEEILRRLLALNLERAAG
jgi:hypothetical protein